MKAVKCISLFLTVFFACNFLSSLCFANDHTAVKLLAISGSIRKDSCNKKALQLLANAARAAGAKVTMIDLAEYPLPLYEGDLEAKQGLPANAKKLQALIAEHDGLIIASPEYNGLPTPLLKNVLDWTSRPEQNNPNSGLKIFENKVAAIISASPGPLGGIRGLPITAELLLNLGLIIVPDRVTIGNCFDSFNAKGELKDHKTMELIKKEGQSLTKLTQALKQVK